MKTLTYFFETYGCQMNESESFSMEQLLLQRCWKASSIADDASLIIINTCSVRITAENRVLGRLGYYSALKKKSKFFVLLIGCMAERLYDDIKKTHPLIDYVVGMFERHLLPKIFEEIEIRINEKDFRGEVKFVDEIRSQEIAIKAGQEDCDDHLNDMSFYLTKDSEHPPYYFAPFSYHEGSFQSFVPIMNGCNNFCTYCIVPYVRGREMSRPVQDILDEVSQLSLRGVKEITLLGQNVNSYRGATKDGKVIDFPTLLYLIDKEASKADQIKWIRFVSSHPKDMSNELIDTVAHLDRLCKAVHLPVQHGSDEVLKRMNRRYTASHYISKIEYLRKKIPEVSLTADILMGFPGETEEDVKLTLELMKKIEFDSAFMYHYNPREGTVAYNFPDRIEEKVKLERLQRVIDLQLAITSKKMLSKVGKEAIILLESVSRNNSNELFGHTEANEMAVVEGLSNVSLIGQFVKVKELKGKTFRCVALE